MFVIWTDNTQLCNSLLDTAVASFSAGHWQWPTNKARCAIEGSIHYTFLVDSCPEDNIHIPHTLTHT